MDVTLDQESAAKLQALLDRGAFASASEALTEAVKLLDEHCPEDWLWENREYVREALEESFAQSERGEGYSPEESMALLDKRRAERRPKAA